MIKVGVAGALGKMGSTTCDAVINSDFSELVYKINPDSDDPTIVGSIAEIDSEKVDVIVDFTDYENSKLNIEWCIRNKVPVVVGTTGFTQADLDKYEVCDSLVMIIPNFAIGAILMMQFAKESAKYFSTAEIIEYHHNNKKDAPSGTARLTAEKIIEGSKEWQNDPTVTVDNSTINPRGANYDGVHVHSVRMEGMIAHQEVLFGTTGETLTIRHDSYSRESFMPGVLLSIKKGFEYFNNDQKGLILGLDTII